MTEDFEKSLSLILLEMRYLEDQEWNADMRAALTGIISSRFDRVEQHYPATVVTAAFQFADECARVRRERVEKEKEDKERPMRSSAND